MSVIEIGRHSDLSERVRPSPFLDMAGQWLEGRALSDTLCLHAAGLSLILAELYRKRPRLDLSLCSREGRSPIYHVSPYLGSPLSPLVIRLLPSHDTAKASRAPQERSKVRTCYIVRLYPR